MTFGEMKEFVLQLLHQYTVAGDVIPETYNGQADDLARIPFLTRDALLYVTTTNRKLRAVAELSHPEKQGEMLVYDLPDDCYQLMNGGLGTATSEFVEMLGLNKHKAVIISVIREDMTDTIMNCLEEKFKTIKKGKGIAFAVPLSSVIGVNNYRFLSNNRLQKGE